MFGKNDAEKYQALFGIVALISMFLISSSAFFMMVFAVFLIAAIVMTFVESYGKKTNSTPIKYNTVGVIGTLLILVIVAGVLGGNQQQSEQSLQDYEDGVVNFNKAVSFLNEGYTNLNKEDTSVAVAKFELSNDFFRQAKTDFEKSMEKSQTNVNLNKKAKYLMQSSDYYSKGIDEYTDLLRLLDKYKGTNLLTKAIGVVLDPESAGSIPSDLYEIKIKSEKAKSYFDLAKNAKESSEKITY